MLNILIKAIVLAVVLYVVYYIVGLLVAALALPAFITLVVGALLVLGFLVWLIRAFGITF